MFQTSWFVVHMEPNKKILNKPFEATKIKKQKVCQSPSLRCEQVSTIQTFQHSSNYSY